MVGVAPNTQIINMKALGNSVCTDAVLIAAIEDAVVLGADVVNLSPGTPEVGSSCASEFFQGILEELSQRGILALGAIGNDGSWLKNNGGGHPKKLYVGDVNLSTTTPPSSYADFMGVAWADGDGTVAHFLHAADPSGKYPAID